VSKPPPPKPSDTIQAQVEQLTGEAKKLNSAGKEAQALETYRKAAELMPGAPWLQHRTAELARKLKQPDVAAQHYRRAGAAFIGAGFPKRALGPLRTAWAIRVAALPADANGFASLTLDLAELQKELGFPADAAVSIANANEALHAAGCAERVPALGELAQRASEKPLRASDPGIPPESGVKPSSPTGPLGILARFRSALKP
jgi:tetratricopeptide (TPR) repeat protein